MYTDKNGVRGKIGAAAVAPATDIIQKAYRHGRGLQYVISCLECFHLRKSLLPLFSASLAYLFHHNENAIAGWP